MCRCSVPGISLGREVPEKSGQMDILLPCDINFFAAIALGSEGPQQHPAHDCPPPSVTFSKWAGPAELSGAL